MGHKKSVRCEPCGKRLYWTEEQVIKTILTCAPRTQNGLRYYRCTRGGNGWHITKKPHRFW